MTRIVLVDGRVKGESQIGVPPLERTSGIGAFEVLRTHDRALSTLVLHLERLERALSEMGISCDGTALLQEAERAAFEIDGEARVDIRVEHTAQGVERTVIASSLEPTDKLQIVSAATVRGPRATSAGHKVLAYGAHGAALTVAREKGCSDALLIDDDGYVREAATANVFGIRGKTLRTPDSDVLRGVTRALVLDFVSSMGLTIELAPHSVDSLQASDEVFLTSAVRGVAAVNMIDGRTIGTEKHWYSGAIASELQSLLRRK